MKDFPVNLLSIGALLLIVPPPLNTRSQSFILHLTPPSNAGRPVQPSASAAAAGSSGSIRVFTLQYSMVPCLQ
jgi:hypothetical protein